MSKYFLSIRKSETEKIRQSFKKRWDIRDVGTTFTEEF